MEEKIYTCLSCGTKNKVPFGRLSEAKCGKCHEPLTNTNHNSNNTSIHGFTTIGYEKRPEQTLLASCVATVAIIPALFPAWVIVFVYTWFFDNIISMSGSIWPDFVDEIALVWSTEFLRGIITGSFALFATNYFFTNANKTIAAISAGAFWGGVMVFAIVFSWFIVGFTTNLIGGFAMMLGLVSGLWIAQNNDGEKSKIKNLKD